MNGDTRELRRTLLDLGVGGVVVLLTVCLSHAIVPFPAELMTMWPISTRVNKPDNDDPGILERLKENEPSLL